MKKLRKIKIYRKEGIKHNRHIIYMSITTAQFMWASLCTISDSLSYSDQPQYMQLSAFGRKQYVIIERCFMWVGGLLNCISILISRTESVWVEWIWFSQLMTIHGFIPARERRESTKLFLDLNIFRSRTTYKKDVYFERRVGGARVCGPFLWFHILSFSFEEPISTVKQTSNSWTP